MVSVIHSFDEVGVSSGQKGSGCFLERFHGPLYGFAKVQHETKDTHTAALQKNSDLEALITHFIERLTLSLRC